jgi:PIN domain nuclease of toxin-antitoxin system
MQLLLDTHVFLSWVDDASDLSQKARRAITDAGNDCFVSIVSAWEMAIKLGLGKLRLPQGVEPFVAEQLATNRFRLLNLELRHIGQTVSLPFHHRNPFDRLLIAQALQENLSVVTADRIFAQYECHRVW